MRKTSQLQSCLTPKQVTLLQDYQRSLQEKRNHGVQEELRSALSKQEAENSLERKVVSLIKIRVADYYGRQKGNSPCTSMFTIWRPAEDLISQLIEGKRFQLTNLSASGARFQWNSSCAQLASTRSTRYLERPTQEEILDSIYRHREAVSLQSLASGCHQSMYGEVDVVGLVAAVKGGSGGLQKVYLTDEHCHLVEVRFWNGLKLHHIEDIVQPGSFITACNLQIRGAETSVLHATELSLFSMNPKAKVFQQSLMKLKNQVKDVTAILYLVEESIDQLTNRQKPQRPSVKISNNNNSTISSSGYSSASNSFIASPSGKEHQTREENDLGQGVTHYWVPYEGKVSSSLDTAASTPHATKQSQFTKRMPQGNDGVSQFCRRNPVTPNQMLIANPSEDKVSAKKKDIQRRSSLLARIPSPPPLTPLPDCTTPSLKKEFRTPVRGSTPSSVPVLSCDMVQNTSAEKKIMAVSKNFEVPSSSAREETGCVLVFKDNAEDGSIEDSLTATQAARLEVGQLTDVELKELAGSWSQPLSYSSSDENTPEMKRKPCERGGVEELKGKDEELHLTVDVDKYKSLEEETVMKNNSLCELKAGEENTLLGGSRNCRGQPAQVGGRSLSRKKRERLKQEPVDVDVTSVKRRKLRDDSCQMEFQSENHLDSSRFLSEKDCPLGVKDSGTLKSSKPERDGDVGVKEDEINVRTNDKSVSSNDHNSYTHAGISGETIMSHKNLSSSIQKASVEDDFHGGSQGKEREDTPETITGNTDGQMNVSSSAVQKSGRKGRKFRRSNVNLALLDETNLQVSPEHDRLSSRLRKRSRPSYKE
ncbi:Breast cancer type 2 susceptibility protein [Holothuria leucospilota]|uniref:Breast cancer type 2 susceptibility protein n=1 Tax=Holothuria leucospilota TaxID=206669 RepID=A0A9Q1GZZ0_HOLLE|nr:Breast cancer type 2 susceptibility protein [Holothuria leucospilota]